MQCRHYSQRHGKVKVKVTLARAAALPLGRSSVFAYGECSNGIAELQRGCVLEGEGQAGLWLRLQRALVHVRITHRLARRRRHDSQ
jgi:hypothetical protein